MTKKDIDLLLEVHAIVLKNNPEWRRGQAFFNILHIMFPEIANEIRGSNIDPFYIDSRIETCIAHLCIEEAENL